MNLYKIYGKELISIEVEKETKCFYFLKNCISAFGFSSRIDKKDALLSPQEAILEALNNRKTMRGAFQDKLAEIEIELKCLENLQKEHNQSVQPTETTGG